MQRFSLYENGQNLKTKLQIKNFHGQTSWTKSANICKADNIPTIIKNHTTKSLQLMTWGIHPFNDNPNIQPQKLQHQVRSDTLTQTNSFKNAWTNSLNQQQRCVIVAKGFYIEQQTPYAENQINKQYYYVTPHASEDEFFYIAALYTRNKRKYNVVSLTKSTQNDQLKQYTEQMPYLLSTEDVATWLTTEIEIPAILKIEQQIKYNEINKISLEIEDHSSKDENTILTSTKQEETAYYDTDINMKDLDWEKIEKDALQEIAARKATNSNQFPNGNTNSNEDTPTNVEIMNNTKDEQNDDNILSHKPQPANKITIKKENQNKKQGNKEVTKIKNKNKNDNETTNNDTKIQKQIKNNNRKRKRNPKQQVNKETSAEPPRKKYKRNKKRR